MGRPCPSRSPPPSPPAPRPSRHGIRPRGPGEALRALEGADLADATAIKAAARAGKALPAPINQADLARTLEYNVERTRAALATVDTTERAVQAAMTEHGPALVPQAIARARAALAEHKAKVDQAQAVLDEAGASFRTAAEAIRDIQAIVAKDMTYQAPNTIADHRLVTDRQAAAGIHDLIRVLEHRGWGEGGSRTKAAQ